MSEEKRLTRPGPDRRDWYVVAQPGGEAETAIIVGALRSANIPFWVSRESAGTAIVLTAGLLGNIDVLVPEAYYAEAMALLHAEATPLDDGALPLDEADVVAAPEEDWPDDDDPGDDSTGHG
jgi:hypothetical protein